MGPAIFHLIISRDWKRQIWTAPHAPRARVLPLHHVLKKSDYEGNWRPENSSANYFQSISAELCSSWPSEARHWTLTPRETIWYANHCTKHASHVLILLRSIAAHSCSVSSLRSDPRSHFVQPRTATPRSQNKRLWRELNPYPQRDNLVR